MVVASSTGWYTALAASGALEFDDAFRLVQTMALLAEEPIAEDDPGGQLIYALTDSEWRPDPDRTSALEAVLARQTDGVHRSLELGAFSVLSGTDGGIAGVAEDLPVVEIGTRRFPFRAAMQEAWHIPLRAERRGTRCRTPGGPHLVRAERDAGRRSRRRFTPWSTDPTELANHTIREQPVSTYDFARSLRVALREYAPEVILLAGPGASLGEVCAQLIVAEGYRGIRTRAELEAAQSGPTPILLSMRR